MTRILYGHPFSSYTWKAQIALHALGEGYDFRVVDADHPDHAAFVQAAHPAGKFPVLVDGDRTIVEATGIVEHLSTCHPDAGLIPSGEAGAVARMIDRVFDNYVMNEATRVVIAHIKSPENPDRQEIAAAKAALNRSYDWLETWLGQNALPPHVSLVTCAAAPALFYSDWIEEIGPQRPRLSALRAELLILPEVVQCIEAARPFRHFFPPGAPDRD